MLKTRIFVALAAAAIACGTAAIAADNSMRPTPQAVAPLSAPTNTVTFIMSGTLFKFPLPAGFCLPAGRYIAHAQRTANGDGANLTNLSFDDCTSMQQNGDLLRWGMIKTPRNLVNTDVGMRESVIAELKRQFASGEFERQMNQGIANVARDGTSTAVRPLGTDVYGAYVGGTLSLDGRTFSAAWGMTAIKRRLLAVYIYGPYNGPADVQDIINRVRNATRQFVLANGG